MDPAYEAAGRHAGLQIWRIENFTVVPYPKEKYGQFYEGDSYIVLFTEKNEDTGHSRWDVHFWLGSETSQDEAGTCAIKAVELDDALGGVPVQHREVQAHESALFLSRFKSGVRYLKGGVASGFHHVDPDAPYPARLFQVKGRRNVRVSQVEAAVFSMNKSDCFILDAGKEVYVYMGPTCRRIERLKAIQAGNGIRDDDHAGKAKIVIIDETASGGEVSSFFEALGGGSPDDIADDDSVDDTAHERSQEKVVSLHRVWEDDDGLVQSEQVAEKPLAQSNLGSGDCYLLDTGGAGLFVWIGRGSSRPEKVRSMELATKYLEKQGYPKWTKVERVVEGAEPTVFKQYFKSWKEPLSAIGFGRVYTTSQIAASVPEADFDASSLHASKRRLLQKSAGPAFGFMPDDGTGKVEMFRVEDFELHPVDESSVGFLFGGDSYVIKYTYEVNGSQKYIIYFWQGTSSSLDEKAASAIHAVRMDNELSGKAVQVRVVHGHEPAHFLRMFKGRMVVFMGGRASGFKNVHDHDTYDVDGTRLFQTAPPSQVRGTCDTDVRAEQRAEVAASLNSDDVFVLETPSKTYLWIGKMRAASANARYYPDVGQEWEKFKLTYKRQYTEVEDAIRMKLFAEKMVFLDELNQLKLEGKLTWTARINLFADRLDSEEPRYFRGRQKGAVTPVKNQMRAASANARYFRDVVQEWENFKLTFNKQYTEKEDAIRMKLFADKMVIIDEHNQRYLEGKTTFTMKMDHFGDMFDSELSGYCGGTLPDTVDGRQKGAVTPVKNQGASDEEKAMGSTVCGLVSPGRDVTTVTEGDEDDAFWSSLGGQGDYQSSRDLDAPLLGARLFHCSVSPAGRLRVNEVSIFSQEDLNEDDVMVLDSGDEVYVWIGKGASDEEKEKSWAMAKDYISTDPTERSLEKTVILRLNQAEEPVAFTSLFPSWNPGMWQEMPSYDDVKAIIAARNAEMEE